MTVPCRNGEADWQCQFWVGIAIGVPYVYMPHVLQPVAPQLAQELPVPATGADTPASFLEKQAKVDNLRLAEL